MRFKTLRGGETIAEEAVSGDENDLFTWSRIWVGRLRRSLGVAPLSEGNEIATRAALPSNEKSSPSLRRGTSQAVGIRLLSGLATYLTEPSLRTRISRSPTQLCLTYGGTPVMTQKLAWRLSGPWNSRIIFPKNSTFWSKANIRGQSRIGPKRLRRIVLYSVSFQTIWTMVSYSPPRKCISVASDSLQTLATLRNLPSPLGDDARIDMTEASAWINRDFTKARAAANLAIDKATAQGSPVIVSRTYGILCQQEPSISASAEAIQICRNALESRNRRQRS